MRAHRTGSFSLAALAIILGCSTTEEIGPPKCIPGSTAACLCGDGKSGVQTCNGEGSYDACSCGGAPDTGVVGEDATVDSDTPSEGGADSEAIDSKSPSDSGADAGDTSTVPTGSCDIPGDGRTNCGASGTESCCTSILVPGITSPTFSRSYDGITTGHTDAKWKAQISTFRLDKYEVTVGRFRQYVAAVLAGWKPTAGSGKHSHLNGGLGLAGPASGYEPGWDPDYTTAENFPTDKATWDKNLVTTTGMGGDSYRPTWTSLPGGNEKKPINQVNWYDAYAFCIWDGGFLPSEAEWNYAAAGGTEQRVYPWSVAYPPGSSTISDAYATYCGTSCAKGAQMVGSTPLGNGKWGHTDLAGNVSEWTLDFYKEPYNETTCIDCAFTYSPGETDRMLRGGGFNGSETDTLTAKRWGLAFGRRGENTGFRCARKP
jgi:formylglycine-generating enzyme required for sulfatase activity